MATATFPFVFLRRGFREYLAFENAVHEQSGGRRTLQKLHAAGEFVVRGTLLFPNPGGAWRDFESFWNARFGGVEPFLYRPQNPGGAYADFEVFWNARFGGYEPFLYRPQNPGAAVMGDAPAVESATQKDFAATRRYVDTSTLVVRKNGVLQALGVDYSVVDPAGAAYDLGTSAACVVRFVNAPGLGATVALAYEFLHMVRFEGDDLPSEQELEAGGLGAAAVADRTVSVQLRETGPGFSYAEVPNAS